MSKNKKEYKVLVPFKHYQVGGSPVQEDEIENISALVKYKYLELVKPKRSRLKKETKAYNGKKAL